MATQAPTVNAVPFTRLTHPDPATNRIVQDLYDKLAQIQSQLIKVQKSVP